jgi:hypothetical protein
MSSSSSQLTTTVLTDQHAESAFQLFKIMRKTVPTGFLAEKTADDFRNLLGNPDSGGGVGVWQRDQLIAYTLFRRIVSYPFGHLPQFFEERITSGTLAESVGYVVNPSFQGRHLWRYLQPAREKRFNELGLGHFVGLIYHANTSAIISAIKSGGLLINHADDEYGLNFVSYHGPLAKKTSQSPQRESIDLNDIESQESLFRDGYLINRVEKVRKSKRPGWRLHFYRPL